MKHRNTPRTGETETEIMLSVRVTGEYLPGQGTSDLRVFAGPYDITEQLSKYQLQSIATDFEETMRDGEEHRGQ